MTRDIGGRETLVIFTRVDQEIVLLVTRILTGWHRTHCLIISQKIVIIRYWCFVQYTNHWAEEDTVRSWTIQHQWIHQEKSKTKDLLWKRLPMHLLPIFYLIQDRAMQWGWSVLSSCLPLRLTLVGRMIDIWGYLSNNVGAGWLMWLIHHVITVYD